MLARFSSRCVQTAVLAAFAYAALSGCGGSGGGTVPARTAPQTTPSPLHRPSSVLKHIVVIIQENRTVDNLFNGFCLPQGGCADTVKVDPVTHTPLTSASLAAPYSPYHGHGQFVVAYDYGKMDGWSQTAILCPHKVQPCKYSVFVYVPASETAIYRKLATVDGVLSDATFETVQGPSFPAHLYAIAGQAGGDDADHLAIADGQGTCASTNHGTPQIIMTTPFPGRMGLNGRPCKDFPTIFDLLAKAGRSWRYYGDPQGPIRAPTLSIAHLYGSPNFIEPSTRFQTDVANGTLAEVTYLVSPTAATSDHPMAITDPLAGPRWVGSVVDAVGNSPFWGSTAIVIFWDDWGGFYDHVRPPAPPVTPDPFEYGFRVPLIVVSPYAKVGNIDHETRTYAGVLRLIEETFDLPSLHTTDQYEPDGLDTMFDFNQAPLGYTSVAL